MRRWAFCLAVALLTFGIGSFIAAKLYFKSVEQHSISERLGTVENISEALNKDEEIKYGCKIKELVPFWENLDKDAFLKFKSLELKSLNYPKDFQENWGASKNFDCSHFGGIEKEIDLNNDGEKEIFVVGIWYMRDSERMVFQKVNGQLKVIMYDLGSFEDEILEHKTNGFRDVKEITNWSGAERSIRIYNFDGKRYKKKKCFVESYMINKNGNMVLVNNSVITRTSCD